MEIDMKTVLRRCRLFVCLVIALQDDRGGLWVAVAKDVRRNMLSSGELAVTFPVKHLVSSSLGQSKQSYGGSSGDATPSSQAQLVTLNQPFGEFYALMYFGTPPSEVAVTIDTGSELLWVQCQPCPHCEEQILDPIFNPRNSRTFKNVSCASAWCRDSVFALNCSDENECLFAITYADNSSSHGYLSQDTLTIDSGVTGTVSLPDFVFGCADYVGLGATNNGSGIIGLNRGNLSAISQMGVERFSYCLPDRTTTLDSTGYISFGDQNISDQLRYTNLIQNTAQQGANQFYYVNLTGISVGHQTLSIPPESFQINLTSGAGGTIIDTGTALSSLVDAAYSVFRDAIKKQVSGDIKEISMDDYSDYVDTCYDLQYPFRAFEVPTVTFHFGLLDFELPGDTIMWHVGDNTYCLGFTNAGDVESGGMNIIGNFQQQNVLVEIDLRNSVVGFARHKCSWKGSGGAPRQAKRSSIATILISLYLTLLLAPLKLLQ